MKNGEGSTARTVAKSATSSFPTSSSNAASAVFVLAGAAVTTDCELPACYYQSSIAAGGGLKLLASFRIISYSSGSRSTFNVLTSNQKQMNKIWMERRCVSGCGVELWNTVMSQQGPLFSSRVSGRDKYFARGYYLVPCPLVYKN
jgi:hypothetical protein